MLLAIDPGISSGWSLWDQKLLVACGAPRVEPPAACRLKFLVIEKPQKYPNDVIDPNTLITLAVQVGMYAERFTAGGTELRLVLPREWKGQLTKAAHHPRIWAALDLASQSIVRKAGTGLNQKGVGDLMDAVGLGQWAIKQRWYK